MSGDMTLTLHYDQKPPRWKRGDGVLKAATALLKLIRALERETTGKAEIVWDVNVYSFSDHAVIEVSAVGTRKARAAALPILQAATQKAGSIKPPREAR